MKKSLPLFIIVLLISATTLAQNTAADQARATFEKALGYFNAGNYDAFLTHFADDFEAFTGVYSPLLIEGKAGWGNFINGLRNYASASYVQHQPKYRSYGDNTVICNAYFVYSTTTKAGVTEVQNGRETTVLVKMNGQWMIANFHFSPIFL
jgi:ketosteroid isomerase-like protein